MFRLLKSVRIDQKASRRWNRFLWALCRTLRCEKVVIDTVHGYRLAVDYGDSTARAMALGYYETDEVAVIAEWVRPGTTVLDVGANVGYFTLLMAQLVGPAGKVHAFEPNPGIASRLQENIVLNPHLDDGRISVHRVALGAGDGAAEFFCPAPGREVLGGLQDTKRAPVDRVIHVPLRRLDDLCAEPRLHPIDFFKLDVEGGELDVLRGSQHLLSETRPVILFEASEINASAYGYRVFELLAYLEERGYTVRQAGMSYNFLAVPRG